MIVLTLLITALAAQHLKRYVRRPAAIVDGHPAHLLAAFAFMVLSLYVFVTVNVLIVVVIVKLVAGAISG